MEGNALNMPLVTTLTTYTEMPFKTGACVNHVLDKKMLIPRSQSSRLETNKHRTDQLPKTCRVDSIQFICLTML